MVPQKRNEYQTGAALFLWGGWMRQACTLFDLQDGLLDSFDVADFVDAQFFQVAPFQR